MRVFIISLFILSNIFAQSGLTVIGGYNMSRIKYNDADVSENIDIDNRGGFNIGIEKNTGSLIAGASIVQRGAEYEFDLMGYEFSGYDVYNYAALHVLYPIAMGTGLEGFGGLQAGFALGGETHIEAMGNTETEDIDADGFGIDAGLLVGASFMLNEKFGIRASYFLGLTDVAKDGADDENYKNNTISLSALMKL